MIGRLWHRWLRWRRVLDRLAWPLGVVGLVAVAAYNWHLWQHDKALLARMKAPPPRPPLDAWPDLPQVSVLVAAWNEADFIGRHIESFLALRYPHKELVLCAGGTDGTYELARRYAGAEVKVLEQRPGEGKQRALARGLPAASGDVIFLTDADCLLDDDAFERTLYPVAAGAEQVCTGTSRPLGEQLGDPFVLTQAASQLYGSLRSPTYTDGLLGRNCAVKRDLLERSRGLDAPAPTGTDYVLAKVLRQNGARIRQAAHSRMPTRYPVTASAYVRQQRRWLRNLVIIGYGAGDWHHVRNALTTMLLGSYLLLGSLVALTKNSPLVVGWLLAVSAALFNRYRYARIAGALLGSRERVDCTSLMAGMFVDAVAWASALPDLWRRQASRTW